jgi:hypothetical protein
VAISFVGDRRRIFSPTKDSSRLVTRGGKTYEMHETGARGQREPVRPRVEPSPATCHTGVHWDAQRLRDRAMEAIRELAALRDAETVAEAWEPRQRYAPAIDGQQEVVMGDATYQVFRDGQAYKVRITMSGLGILEVKAGVARTGRNPATGETIQIKAGKKVGFRPVKELKEAI